MSSPAPDDARQPELRRVERWLAELGADVRVFCDALEQPGLAAAVRREAARGLRYVLASEQWVVEGAEDLRLCELSLVLRVLANEGAAGELAQAAEGESDRAGEALLALRQVGRQVEQVAELLGADYSRLLRFVAQLPDLEVSAEAADPAGEGNDPAATRQAEESASDEAAGAEPEAAIASEPASTRHEPGAEQEGDPESGAPRAADADGASAAPGPTAFAPDAASVVESGLSRARRGLVARAREWAESYRPPPLQDGANGLIKLRAFFRTRLPQ